MRIDQPASSGQAAYSTLRPDLVQAEAFLELLDPAADELTFQTFDDSEQKRGYLAKVMHGSLDELAEPLATMQRRGAGVFVTVNETDLAGRKEQNVSRIRAVFVDLDGAPLPPVLACDLEPHLIVESSPERWHCYWLVDFLDLDQFKPVQQALAARFAGDPACTDLPRVMRLPGFWHLKGEPFQSRTHAVAERMPYPAAQILAAFPPKPTASADAPDESDRTMTELVRRILAGVEYHSALRDLAYRYVNAGMAGGQVVATLRGLMDARPESERDSRWEGRRAQIPMLVDTAAKKHAAAAPPAPDTIVQVLVAWLRRRYRPCFRENGHHFWSSATGGLVRPGDILPSLDAIDALAAHPDAPHDDKGRVKRQALPSLFRSWISVAISELIASLPTEDEAPICPEAAERLRKRVQLLMETPVTLSFKDHTIGERVTEHRTLVSWCWRFASSTSTEWDRVRSYGCFFARIPENGRIRFALRPELAHQARASCELGQMKIRTLGLLTERYDLGTLETILVHGEHFQVVVLSDALAETLGGSTP